MSIEIPSQNNQESKENQLSTRAIKPKTRTSLEGIFCQLDQNVKKGCLKRQQQRMFSVKNIDDQIPTFKSIKSNKSIQFKKTKVVYTYDKSTDGGKKSDVHCCKII